MSRAVVLTGSAVVGMAWQLGVLSGLAERGVKLADADFILCSAAGASVGWQIASGRPVSTIANAILDEQKTPPPPPAYWPNASPEKSLALLEEMRRVISEGGDSLEVAREIGRWALSTKTIDEATFMEAFGKSLPIGQNEPWPKNFACTAIDVESGEVVVWTAASGIPLARGVLSSCSVAASHPPVTINGRRYMSGAMRTVSNADLAAGHDVVVVLGVHAPVADQGISRRVNEALDWEVRKLREGGARVELIQPDEQSINAIGAKMADLKAADRRPAACRAGIAQGKALAGRLNRVWS